MTRVVLIVSLAVMSCNESSVIRVKKDGSPISEDGGGSIGGEGGGGEGASRTRVRAIDLESLERPDRVPALSFNAVSGRMKSKARKNNAAGLRRYRMRDYPGAIEQYILALEADPGHVLARYNLSCAYNLNREPEKGLALLNEFRQRGCKDCLARLVRASEDADWNSQWNHPMFAEIVGVLVDDAEKEKAFWEQDPGCLSGSRLKGQSGIEVGCYRGAVRHGPHAKWHASGKKVLAEIGTFENGRRSGRWKIFDDKARLLEAGPYRQGKKHGVWSEWYPSGIQSVDGRFIGGTRDGRWTWFEDSGQIQKQADFTRGRRGAWIVAPK